MVSTKGLLAARPPSRGTVFMAGEGVGGAGKVMAGKVMAGTVMAAGGTLPGRSERGEPERHLCLGRVVLRRAGPSEDLVEHCLHRGPGVLGGALVVSDAGQTGVGRPGMGEAVDDPAVEVHL